MAFPTESNTFDRPMADGAAVGPCLFLALQCDRLLAPGLRLRLEGLTAVRCGRAEERSARREELPEGTVLTVELDDSRVSTLHCRLQHTADGWTLEDAGSKNGTLINGEPARGVTLLEDGDLIEIGRTFFIYWRACTGPDESPIFAASGDSDDSRCTLLPALDAALRKLESIGPTTLPVMIRGESGTGKELAASAVHRLSGRSGAFVPVNCGGLSPSLLNSELFGYKKGAFSGAVEDRPGLLRAADRGTLFLDEIGDLPLDGQTALLRFLQEGEVLPLGATKAVLVDARVVAATHRDLEQMARDERFRPDLLARLSGFTLRLPPLRARRPDLGILIGAILRRRLPEKAAQLGLRNSVARALLSAPWPLNVRQLEKALLAAVALSPGPLIELDALAAALEPVEGQVLPRRLAGAELQQRLLSLLRKHAGNVSSVAKELGKDRMQVHRWLKRFGIDARELRPRSSGGTSTEADPEHDAEQ